MPTTIDPTGGPGDTTRDGPRARPRLIQGGMGIGVSNWRLARAVAATGNMGVVSGVAIDSVLVRRLQLGDPGGDVRRALAAYPDQAGAGRILDRYLIEGGKAPDERFTLAPIKRDKPSRRSLDLLIAANFVEVWLAREGHDGPVGVNYLEKVQSPTLPSVYGAMLAGVDFILMGAGIPRALPAVIDGLAAGRPVELPLDVKGATASDDFTLRFDPGAEPVPPATPLQRPSFLAIVSSHTLAVMLATKTDPPVDGFVVEGATAGGHNAPPRGRLHLDDSGQPVYGRRDQPDLDVIAGLGLPFWLAGGYSTPDRVAEALDAGATGVQVGTPFAYCEESGLTAEVKAQVLAASRRDPVGVFTDPEASPSGFPFKVVDVPGTLSDPKVLETKERQPCELGYLRSAHRGDDGGVIWRCPAEPVQIYLSKGGDEADTPGRQCLCNALLSDIGLPQVQRDGTPEPMLITSGDDLATITRFLPEGADGYRAVDVVETVLRGVPAPAEPASPR